jgi:hypothetical protein
VLEPEEGTVSVLDVCSKGLTELPFWNSLQLEVASIPGPMCGQKDDVNWKIQ